MSIKIFVGLVILIIAGCANANNCLINLKSFNDRWSDYLEEEVTKNLHQTKNRAGAVKFINEIRRESDQIMIEKIQKLKSISTNLIPNYFEELATWRESNDNGYHQMINMEYLECIAEERLLNDRKNMPTQLTSAVQININSSGKKQNRNPQTVSTGPVSVTLLPIDSTSSKCYEIAYENRGDKNVDIFIKLTLTNNKTGEKGTSVWLGENTQFDGIFGSANTNRLNPKTQMVMTRTGMYNNWLMAKNFIFDNQPSDLYGFNNAVESCDDITAEIPSGGLKWNENAYQRHYDACSSPIKSKRPVGC